MMTEDVISLHGESEAEEEPLPSRKRIVEKRWCIIFRRIMLSWCNILFLTLFGVFIFIIGVIKHNELVGYYDCDCKAERYTFSIVPCENGPASNFSYRHNCYSPEITCGLTCPHLIPEYELDTVVQTCNHVPVVTFGEVRGACQGDLDKGLFYSFNPCAWNSAHYAGNSTGPSSYTYKGEFYECPEMRDIREPLVKHQTNEKIVFFVVGGQVIALAIFLLCVAYKHSKRDQLENDKRLKELMADSSFLNPQSEKKTNGEYIQVDGGDQNVREEDEEL